MTTADPRLDRRIQFDKRSRAYPIRATVEGKKPRSYTWACPIVLNQGREGACVGHAWTHEAAAKPKPVPNMNNAIAHAIYKRAQQLDPWEGDNYSGTSVLAGAKAAQEKGWLTEYRWAFSLDDLRLAVGYAGPAVLGIPWYSGMYQTDAQGYIRPTGEVVGGHAILCNGVSIRHRRFRVHNSWGADFGMGGAAWLGFDDAEMLIHQQGEACIPIVRTLP